ncbi:group XIIA secretory phospholipase A2-like isoform X1 [Lampetra fluviatilis]
MRTRGLAVGRSWMLPLLLLLLLLPLLMCVAARGGWVAERVKELRAGVQLLDGYLDSAMEYLGGEDGVCRYTCANGAEPEPRRDYTPAAPNGCGSPVFGIQFDVGVPAMTRCCNDHDRCYDVCGAEKRACDTAFRRCLSRICSLVGASFTISPETLGGDGVWLPPLHGEPARGLHLPSQATRHRQGPVSDDALRQPRKLRNQPRPLPRLATPRDIVTQPRDIVTQPGQTSNTEWQPCDTP